MPNRSKSRRNGRKPRANRQVHRDLVQLQRQQTEQSLKVAPIVPDALPMVVKDKVFNAVEKLALGPITASTVNFTSGSFTFYLNMTQASASYTQIYDCWRIAQVSVQFDPRLALGPTTSSLLTVIDYDDASVPGSIQLLYGYNTCQISPAGVIQNRTFTPRVQVQVYQGAVTSYSRASPRMWINTSNPSVPYYSLKWGMNAVGSAPGGPQYDVYASVVFQFKNQKG